MPRLATDGKLVCEGQGWVYATYQTTDRTEEPCAKLPEVTTRADTLRCCLEEADDVALEAGTTIKTIYMGTKKEDPLPLLARALTVDKRIYDAVYKAGEETTLFRWARAAGARTVAGRRVLYQGVRGVYW